MDAQIGVKHMPFMHILNFIYARKASQIKVRKLCKNFTLQWKSIFIGSFLNTKRRNIVGRTPPVIIGGCLVNYVNKSRLLGLTVDVHNTYLK